MDAKILIVDDSATIRKVVRKVVGQAGLNPERCVEAANGKEALEILGQTRFDLVIADVNMPQMNGIEMIRCIRQSPETQELPVLIVSTEGNEDTIRAAMEAGASGYIFKPFTSESLAEKIRPLGLIPEIEEPQQDSEIVSSDPTVF